MVLTDNQQKILTLVLAGSATIDDLMAQTGLAKSSITPIITSLVKKEYITRSEDGTLSAISSAFDEPEPQIVSTTDSITLLIPYVSSPFKGAELRAALRAWAQHYQGTLKVVIVGDREDWFSDKIVHIAAEPHHIAKDCGGCLAPTTELNPQADVVHKMLLAIATGEVEGDFILSNDDIFLLGTTYRQDLEILRHRGDLTAGVGSAAGIYRLNGIRTAKILKEAGLPTLNYGTHTPVILHADNVVEIAARYKATERAYLFTSLYFNTLFPSARPFFADGLRNCVFNASIYRKLDTHKDAELIDHIFSIRKFINTNDSGWPYLEPIFTRMYAPSPFEK